MTIKSLTEFNSTFGTEVREVEVQFGTEAAFSIFLKPLTSASRDAFEASCLGTKGERNLENLRARLVAKCWVDDAGKPVGTADEIGEMRAEALGAVFDKVRILNGMDKDVVKEAKND